MFARIGSRKIGRYAVASWVLMVFATIVSLILLFPIYWMVVTSVLPTSLVLSERPPLVPPLSKVNFEPYLTALARKPIFQWFSNTLIIAAGSASLSVVIASMAGYSLSRFRTRGQQVVGLSLLLNRMLPGTLLIIPLFLLFSQIHLVDSPVTLILINTTFIVPFATWMLKGFFDGIPLELEEAAMVDGCSRIGAMRRITLPLSMPGLSAMVMYSFILSWGEFLYARTMLNDPERWTLSVGIVSLIGEHVVDWNLLMAAGIIAIAPVFLLFFLLEPFLVSGMTSGSVKG